ncbi:MAG: 1,2-phenylacetyl-CoA epoxidase subunit PaaC [Jatrophihabitans sp.]|uniref:1,2-phenylacetyl-CoA epoxidase subunit PaaC n=1 Tax=Jatrophihabitans sp. TaxID=1932789 RepID=UPI003F7CE05A
MDHDNPYDLLGDDSDTGHRWAFGTNFVDPLEGIDTRVPDDVDADALARTCLGLGDDALILSHRLQQWITRLPELEEETAIANIALDLLGQARLLLARAGTILGRNEDELAYLRTEGEFRNVRLVEPADTDFADLVARLLVVATWRLATFEALTTAPDPVLAAIAAKGAKELAYHRDHAALWVVRLGDGTELSHTRMQAALERIWPYVDELFADAPLGATVDRGAVDAVLDAVFAAATLDRPAVAPRAGVAGRTGRDGVHTEALGYVLAELQSVARAHPDATW